MTTNEKLRKEIADQHRVVNYYRTTASELKELNKELEK